MRVAHKAFMKIWTLLHTLMLLISTVLSRRVYVSTHVLR